MALLGKSISYEVLVGEGARWILDAPYDHKPDAMARAQLLLESNQHDAVKVNRLKTPPLRRLPRSRNNRPRVI